MNNHYDYQNNVLYCELQHYIFFFFLQLKEQIEKVFCGSQHEGQII